MTTSHAAVLFTSDDALARAITAYATAFVQIRRPSLPTGAERLSDPSLVFIDLRVPGALDYIARWREQTDHVIIALGAARSDPVREAEAMGVYAVESFEPERLPFQALVAHAVDRLELQQEIRVLRETASRTARPESVPSSPPRDSRAGDMSLHHFSRAWRRFDDPASLLESMVEGLAGTAKVTRVGLFSQTQEAGPYRLQAHLRCLEGIENIAYESAHPFVRWMEAHAHMVARSTLGHVADAADRLLLRQILDELGAEIVIPLFARGRLTGWLFLGQRATGIPFAHEELEELNEVTEHIATMLENAKLYEEVALQKTLAETLFQSIPIGVAAVDAHGFVRWFNDAAGRMLKLAASEVLNQPVDTLGSRLTDHLRRTFFGEPLPEETEWRHPETHCHVAVQTHRLLDQDNQCLGAVALIHDMTEARKLKEKQEQLDRAAFWTELAASMSHEIRNPLVAIKTFAQLLPERYDDPDFRAEFSRMVSTEVGRLDGIIEQINAFANPPARVVEEVDLKEIIDEAVRRATAQHPVEQAKIETAVAPNLPRLEGDKNALQETVQHLVVNALEALSGKTDGRIEIRAETHKPDSHMPGTNGNKPALISLCVRDTGCGLPQEIRDKVFSPFCTTKARGMGLGLSIAKRTAIDHNGQIEIDSHTDGTQVSLQLPAASGDRPLRREHG